ncbi:MAG: InlB B-repeat-containing protein [Lachnospiraceae bacterium]|nr:InlB B-repeat-containing protein [Lachnospiraceae bacterium]
MKVRKMVSRLVRIALAASVATLLLLQTAFAAEIKIDTKNFPDTNFRYWVLNHVDTDKNGSLSAAEIKACTTFEKTSSAISSLKGIEYLTELKKLVFQGEISGRVDLRKNTKLEEVNLAGNYEVTSVDVSACTNLKVLDVSECSIRTLDVSKNTKLTKLVCTKNYIQTLDLGKNTALTHLDCSQNSIKTLDVSKLTKLEELTCYDNKLTTLDISKNTALKVVECSGNAISSLVLGTTYADHFQLFCSSNNLTSLDVSKLNLYALGVNGNRLNVGTTLKLGGYVSRLYNETPARIASTVYELYSQVWYPTTIYYDTDTDEFLCIDRSFSIGEDVDVDFVHGKANYNDSDMVTHTTQKAGQQFTIPKINIASNTQYFLGWSFAPNATTPDFKTGDKITVYRRTVLFPVWKDKTYSVNFYLNGGTSGAPAAIKGIPCRIDLVEIPSSSPVREGYYFLGWASEKTVSQAQFKGGDAAYTAGADMALYAIWKPRTNKISFDLNGGSGTVPATISVLTGESASIPKANVSRSGYWFLGWSTNKNATSATYKSDSKISVTKDTVLYAVWKSSGTVNCTLTFNANGGSGAPAAITAAKDSTVTIPKATVTRDGYWFLGWATSKTATTAQYKSGNTLTLSANTTLYAVWKKK